MANSITGAVHLIEPAVSIPYRSDPSRTLTKRTIVLCVKRFNPVTGEQDGADNFPAFEFLNDKCALLDQFKPGEYVTVTFDLKGSQVTGQDGRTRWLTSIQGYRIEPYQRQGAAPQPQARMQPQAQPVRTYPQPAGPQSAPQQPQQQYVPPVPANEQLPF